MADDPSVLYYRCKPLYGQIINGDKILVRDDVGNLNKILPPALKNFLFKFTEFDSLDNYIDSYIKELNKKEWIGLLAEGAQFLMKEKGKLSFKASFFKTILKDCLSEFAKLGFLISYPDFKIALSVPQNAPEGPSISTLGIVTKNRIESLTTCLTSYISNAKLGDNKIEYCIHDDATHRDLYPALEKLKSEYRVPIFYAGFEEKKAFLKELSNKGFPLQVLEFGFFGRGENFPTYGGNRNSFLLNTIDQLSLSSDDDLQCRVSRSSIFKEGLKLGMDDSMERLKFINDRADVFKITPESQTSIFDIHNSFLGKSLKRIVTDHSQNSNSPIIDTKNLGGDLMQHMLYGRGSVRITTNGLGGDSGMSDPSGFLFSTGDTRKKILNSEEDYEKAFQNRELIKEAEKSTLYPSDSFMSTVFGLDNRGINPPFFPMFRDEDNLFGVMVGSLMEGSCTAFLPWNLFHNPEGGRKYGTSERAIHIQVHVSDIIEQVVRNNHSIGTIVPIEAGIKHIGAALIKLGNESNHEFISQLNTMRMIFAAQKITKMESLLKKYPDSPKYWKNDIEKIIEQLSESLESNRSHYIAFYIENAYGEEGSINYMKEILRLYGELLILWPDIISETRNLKNKGIRLAKEV